MGGTSARGTRRPLKTSATPLLGAVTRDDFLPQKTIRVASTGDVLLNKLELQIVDTAAFQRLRGIKQLGPTYWIYPTALHTRFDHSLGVFEMAKQIVAAIRGNQHNAPEEQSISLLDEQLIRLYALLHDIGHVPFGHTLEDEFRLFPRHDKDDQRLQHFLGPESEIGSIVISSIGEEAYTRLLRLFGHVGDPEADLKEDAYIYDIVSNTVCADLLDYLRRDCHFCGLEIGVDYRFMKFLYLAATEHGKVRRLAVRLWKAGKPWPKRDLLTELLRLLDNRYLLAERVYFHHAKLIAGAMLAGAVQRDAVQAREMWAYSDDTLLDRLVHSKDPVVRKLANALVKRHLWNEIRMRGRLEVQGEQSKDKSQDVWKRIAEDFHNDATSRLAHERRVASYIGLADGDYLIYCPPEKMAFKPAEMKVFWNGKLRPLRECLDDPMIKDRLSAILDAHQQLWAMRAFLNPEQEHHEREAQLATDYLFALTADNKRTFLESFVEQTVRRVVTEESLAGGMTFEDSERRVHAAVREIAAKPHLGGIKDLGDIKRIVKDAFAV